MVKKFNEFINESIWGDINRRSQGQQIRKEDDIDLKSPKELYDYLISNYEPQRGYSIDNVITISNNNRVISIQVYENKNHIEGGITLKFNFDDEWHCASLDPDSLRSDIRQVPDWLVKKLEEFTVMNDAYYPQFYLIYPKDDVKTTNKFLIKILDCILECMDDSVRYYVKLKKK